MCVALVAALFANISIVGLNQCFDIEIDRVNKPYLPLASGEWSLSTGVAVVVATGVAAVILAATLGTTPLLVTVLGSLLLGVAYSVDLPILRWKYNPVAAAGCIIAVRAVLVQVCIPLTHPLDLATSCVRAATQLHSACHSKASLLAIIRWKISTSVFCDAGRVLGSHERAFSGSRR